jgi:hypothetical protein
MSYTPLVPPLQPSPPTGLQAFDPIIEQLYRDHLQTVLDSERQRWYVRLTTQYLIDHLLTVYRRRVGHAGTTVDAVEAGPVDLALAQTVADHYQGQAWQAFGLGLARELWQPTLAAGAPPETLPHATGLPPALAAGAAADSVAVVIDATTVLEERLTALLTRKAREVAVAVADSLLRRAPALADLEHLLGLPPTSLPGGTSAHGLPLLREAHLTVLSAAHYQALREALYKNTFQRLDGVPWPTALLATGPAQGHVQLRPVVTDTQTWLPPEALEAWVQRMWRQRAELSDLDADVLDALCALWLAQTRSPKDDAVAHVDQLLTLRGLQAHPSGQGRRGGYTPPQRQAVLQALDHLQNLWLRMAEMEVTETPTPGKRRRIAQKGLQSRAVIITDLFGQLRPDGFLDVEQFVFRPGQVFGHFLFGPGRQTALLAAQALRYDPYRATWEKRLTRYLSYQWRCRAHGGAYLQPYRVETLLIAVGATVDRAHPGRTRTRLERALDRLLADGVIAAWQYERWEEACASRPGWVERWLQATLLIEPPAVLQQQYQRLAHEAAAPPTLPAPDTLGTRLKRRRQQRGLTLIQAAEQLQMSPGYLSRLEQGRRGQRLPAAVQRKLDTWLADPRETLEAAPAAAP